MLFQSKECINRLLIFCAFTGLLAILTGTGCTSRKGCIDNGSLSYDPDARIDDGSCIYPEYHLTPLKLTELNSDFIEISACKFLDSRVFTIIDPPGENKIYSLNMVTGNEKEEIEIPAIEAVNFEALASSDTHFFIGDIGNNNGQRTDLVVYKIARPAAYTAHMTAASYETIRFSYPEQTDFRSNVNTNYDAEALIYFNGMLYVFTKNHADNKTYLYEFPAVAGSYKARLRGIFDVKCMITDADINHAGNKLVLIGHTLTEAFVWVMSGFEGTKFFSGKKSMVDLGPLTETGQVEGVSFYNDDYLFITNEHTRFVHASLFYLDISTVK